MKSSKSTPDSAQTSSFEAYFTSAPAQSHESLSHMRRITQEEIPDGLEVISHGIPTVKKKKNVVHYAGYASHIGFYPGSEVLAAFENRLAQYKRAKGSVQFPLGKPLPEALIREMIQFRLQSMNP